jgi:putative flippase GtrA
MSKPATERGALLSRLLPLQRLARELARFGTVGAFGVVVNAAVFNLCIRVLDMPSVRSGVIATAVATGTNYLGNRYWAYRQADKQRVHREVVLFLLFSGIGLVIENGALALSHYGLGFTSPLADNVAKYVVGLGLGTLFRFWSYRTWVFRSVPRERQHEPEAVPATPERAERVPV